MIKKKFVACSVGYTDCPCRDCFEISMDGKLCSLCEEAGCDEEGNSECLGEHSYCSGDDDADATNA